MRDEDPVLLQPGLDAETPIWFVSRYDDVASVLLDDDRFVRDAGRVFTPDELETAGFSTDPVFQLIENHMLNKDGADHRRLRRLVTKAFTPGWSSSCVRACTKSQTTCSTACRTGTGWTSSRSTRSRCRSSSSPSCSEFRQRSCALPRMVERGRDAGFRP